MTENNAFDVGAYTRASSGPIPTPDMVPALDADLADAVAFVARRAGDTSTWLAQVLVTATHKDARITAFLSTWAYEQIWLSASLAGLAYANVEDAASVHPRVGNRWAPLVEALFSNVYGHALTGVQITERYIDSLVLDAMLERIQMRVPAEAQAAVEHVRATLARQRDFFQETALRELAGSAATRMLTRRRVRRCVFPMGAERENWLDVARVFRILFKADETWAARLDSQLDALPGLQGLHVISKTVKKFRLY